MILQKFEYSEFDGQPNFWTLKDFSLNEKINLLVGKNATGKTNSLTKTVWLGNMLAGLQPQLLNSGNYDTEFIEGEEKYHYILKISAQKIICEKLCIDDKEMFTRTEDGKGRIVASQYKEPMQFQLSSNQLVVVSKRDSIQHPYLEKLFKWADGVRFYEFGTTLGKDMFVITNNLNNININPHDTNSVVALYIKGEREFPQQFRNRIKNAMKEIDYDISNISAAPLPSLLAAIPYELMPPTPPNSFPLALYVGEANSRTPISQQQMSQGMFRAFSLIIQLTYNLLSKSSSTILIDDIGEGLDFERSSGIIKLITHLAEESSAQAIMSTNDRFVMNNVPLEYWQVIQRKGGECQVFNYQNSKEKFDEFECTGLNNFDFLRTDFLNSDWESV
jgi:hypothetical protein